MWTLCVENGLHAGITFDLKPGLTQIGSGEQVDLLLLDEDVPALLVQWQLDESGVLTCVAADERLQFSYDGLVWTQARAEVLFSVNLQYRFEAQKLPLTFSLVRAAQPSDLPVDSSEPAAEPVESLKAKRPRWLFAAAGIALTLLLAAFWFVVDTTVGMKQPHATPSGSDKRHGSGLAQSGGEVRHDGMVLSYGLSMGHRAPPGYEERDIFDKPSVSKASADGAGVSDAMVSSGSDAPEPGSTLRISQTLTMGKPFLDADKLAEPALYMLQERLEKYAWGKRIVINARGRKLHARATLSESERHEFERVTQQLVREYGNNIEFRALVEPLEPPTQLLVKQVLGGSSPVVILEDGSRLMQGSMYDGKLVESISIDKIVLRGKDRVEIPI